jgi:6-phosphogluconolactonase
MKQALLIGGYAQAGEPGLQVAVFDEDNAALAAEYVFEAVPNPTFSVVHANGRWVYMVSETGSGDGGEGHVVALALEREPWGLREINRQASGGDHPCHLAFSVGQRWLAVTNYSSGSARVFPIESDGALGAPSDHVQHVGHGPNAVRQQGPHAHATTFTPDGRYAIVADLGIDALVVYRFEAETGRLIDPVVVSTPPGAGPRHMVLDPAGRILYAAMELDATIGVYAYEPDSSPVLREIQVLATLPPDALPGTTAADIHIDLLGGRLLMSNRGHNSLAVCELAADGRLSLLGTPSCGGDWPRNFALPSGGRHILVANQYSHRVDVLALPTRGAGVSGPLASLPAQGAACICPLP